MRNRTSSALAFSLCEDGMVGFNFLRKSAFQGSGELLSFLSRDQSWRVPLADEITLTESCIELGALVSEDSDEAEIEDEFSTKWAWGLPAALYHFSVQGNPSLTLEEGEMRQVAMAESCGLPELFLKHDRKSPRISLADSSGNSALMSSMARRRSNREAADQSIQLQNIADIIYSGMGITGFTKNSVVELPLSMTPSGGARNPYEAFVIARKVDGLDPGVYHYSAFEHSLKRIGEAKHELSDYVGSQDWADSMSCVIVLAAYFERTMWKYDDPNAYRVVLIEAGHIGQNMLLTATELGMAACPTAALDHDLLYENLKLPSRITCAPIYAIAVGAAAKGP